MPTSAVTAPFAGSVVTVSVAPGDRVHVGQALLILESMKMEHVVEAVRSGTVRRLAVGPGDAVTAGATLVEVEEGRVDAPAVTAAAVASPGSVRPELAELRRRVANTLDEGRVEATTPTCRRKANGSREH
jgi:pyruvate/2-oxoglutarate dehydrogenase complex dihydrolipoamide acyltransferase (E2) component